MATFRAILPLLMLFLTQRGEQINVVHLESLMYPVLARQAQLQGGVAVDLTVSSNGEVVAVSAISGHEILRRAATENAKKWKFNEGTERHLRILYDFILVEPKTDYKPETRNIYDLPNRVQVISNLAQPQP